MNRRRDPFTNPPIAPESPASIYDSIRVAAPRRRNRQWEREHQNDKAVYRGVDPKLSLKVKTIASELFVPSGEVARAVIEFSLRAYEAGELALYPRPNPYRLRMTLFANPDSTHSSIQPKRSGKRKQAEALWRVITTWRGFPHELKAELTALACEEELNVPIGELITALLRFGLKAHDDGRLTLKAVPKAATFTLATEDAK